MSRIGKQPITIPAGTTVKLDGQAVTATGPQGSLSYTIPADLTVKQQDDQLVLARNADTKQAKALHGLARSLVANIVAGVTAGYTKKLELVGTGYRVAKKGQGLSLSVGFSHPVEINPPDGITLEVDSNTQITVKGPDKQLVGQVAADIRAVRPPEPYKGKGIRLRGEVVRRKPGKQAKTEAA